MTDITAWVPLWEQEPALVPDEWQCVRYFAGDAKRPYRTGWHRVVNWDREEGYEYSLPESPELLDLAAQLGTAVQWLASRDAYAVATIEAGPDIATTLELLRVRVEARLGLDCAAGESK